MSDKKPFAEVDDIGCVVVADMQSLFTCDIANDAAERINAAVSRERREAAAEALAEAARELCPDPKVKCDPRIRLTGLHSWLRDRAERTRSGVDVRNPELLDTLGLRAAALRKGDG